MYTCMNVRALSPDLLPCTAVERYRRNLWTHMGFGISCISRMESQKNTYTKYAYRYIRTHAYRYKHTHAYIDLHVYIQKKLTHENEWGKHIRISKPSGLVEAQFIHITSHNSVNYAPLNIKHCIVSSQHRGRRRRWRMECTPLTRQSPCYDQRQKSCRDPARTNQKRDIIICAKTSQSELR